MGDVVELGKSGYPQLSEMYDRLDRVLDDYIGVESRASVIGILHLLAYDITEREVE